MIFHSPDTIVQRLWNYCNVLRDDGISYGDYVGSLGAMIGQFESRTTKRIWSLPGLDRHPIWQRNYHEHIIRNDQEYPRVIQYIQANPLRWQEDQVHHGFNKDTVGKPKTSKCLYRQDFKQAAPIRWE